MIVAAAFLIPAGCILVFTSRVIRTIPKHEDECPDANCRPPLIMPHYRDRITLWFCGCCGRHWRVESDLSLPRGEHRYWVRSTRKTVRATAPRMSKVATKVRGHSLTPDSAASWPAPATGSSHR